MTTTDKHTINKFDVLPAKIQIWCDDLHQAARSVWSVLGVISVYIMSDEYLDIIIDHRHNADEVAQAIRAELTTESSEGE